MGGDIKPVPLSVLLKYYKRLDVQRAIADFAQDREVGVFYGNQGSFGKRPDVVQYPSDVLNFVKQGVTSFHASEELWKNPLQLSPDLKRQELDDLRLGWDLVLDIDCKFLEYSIVAADVLVQALRHHDIVGLSVKFSGNHGFHIFVPHSCFPETVNGLPVSRLFPDGPRKIAAYLKQMVKSFLSDELLAFESLTSISKKTGKSRDELLCCGVFDPFSILDIDTILIASRHLFRMPYSLNEKSGLVSIPLNFSDIRSFDRAWAVPERVDASFVFGKAGFGGEASKLLVSALDFVGVENARVDVARSVKPVEVKEFEEVKSPVPVVCFPPCIQHILKGLVDGRKRSLFILVNFLSSVGWDYDMIENFLLDWNKKHSEPLREVLILGHVRYHKQINKRTLPPNCLNKGYYQDMRFCWRSNPAIQKDSLCDKIKNPVNFAVIKFKISNEHEHDKRGSKEGA